MCFVPILFRGTNPYYVVDLLNNDCFSSPIKHNNALLNTVCLAVGLRSDPLGGELTALARPQLLGPQRTSFEKVGGALDV